MDSEITAIPVGQPNAIFKKIRLTNKGDYFEVYRDGDLYVGWIRELAEVELWQVHPVNGPALYAGNRSLAAELACIIFSYIKREHW